MSSQQQKRVAEQQDGEQWPDGEHGKRSRALAMPDVEVKQEQRVHGGEAAGQGGQGEGALVPVAQAMEEAQINVRMSVSRLHCHACVLPLKPPTYKCGSGHIVCDACRGSHARACAAAGVGAYAPCAVLDDFLRDVKVPCANETYGCTSWLVYYEAAEHHRSCRFAPCSCPVPGCGHSTSPARLADHFSRDHAWPVSKVHYARPSKFAVPGPQDKLVLVGAADGSVFLLSPRAFGAATAVPSLVCVRACGDAAAGAPQYVCHLWTDVADDELTLRSVVVSSDMAGGFPAIDQGIFLPPPPLHDKSGEPAALMIQINSVGVSTARSRPRASSTATPPSMLPGRMMLQ